MAKTPRHPRLAFWTTVILAVISAAIAVYHLGVIAVTLADANYVPMLGGFTGSLYLIFDYFVMSLPICLLLILSMLLNLFWSHALSKGWTLSAIASIAVFLICGLVILLGCNSGALAVSLNLAARAIAESLTAVTLTHSLTKSYLDKKRTE